MYFLVNWYQVFYWMTVAGSAKATFDAFSNLFLVLMVISGLILLALHFIAANLDNDQDKDENKSWKYWLVNFRKLFIWSTILCFITWTLWAIIPTKKDMLLIVVGGAVGNFVTSDSSSRAIPADLTKYLHKSLQKEINDLDEDTKEELGVQTPKDRLIKKAKDMSKEELIEWLKTDTTTLK